MRYKVLLIFSLFWLGFVNSSHTYEDAQAKFAIDLPLGFKLDKLKKPTYEFINDKGFHIVLGVAQTDLEVAEAYAAATKSLNLLDVRTETRRDDAEVNGYRARWGVVQYAVKEGSTTRLVMVGYIGAVKMGRTIVTFISLVAEPDTDRVGDVMEKSFRTIRRPTGYVAPAPSTWTNPAVTLDLPAGWAADPPDPGSPKQAVAVFSSESLGARMSLICYPNKKPADLLKSGREGARKMLKAVATEPPRTEKTAAGQELLIELFSYTATIDEKQVEEVMYSAATGGRGCGLLFTGLAPKANAAAALREMQAIVKSAR
jgi:hypothetical protein